LVLEMTTLPNNGEDHGLLASTRSPLTFSDSEDGESDFDMADLDPDLRHSPFPGQQLNRGMDPSALITSTGGTDGHIDAPTPRSATNRVRFNLDDVASVSSAGQRGDDGDDREPPPYAQGNTRQQPEWMEVEDDDYLEEHSSASAAPQRNDRTSQRAPLLTDIEAPSVTASAGMLGGDGWDPDRPIEDLLESSRPKSGMREAFMNMANSIIGAGIIGQPYAFRQAGLLTGILLLIGLTITVDWTIRLIVVNAKLSGASSFQETVEKCYGQSGLVAISVSETENFRAGALVRLREKWLIFLKYRLLNGLLHSEA
jgi:Transmembrane amino acid transporter protein